VAYLVGFAVVHGLPVAFALIAVTVWAALRMPTTFVVLHDLVVGAAAVLFTLHGTGTFAAVHDDATRAIIAQVFVAVVAVVGLALALGRDERQVLLEQLAADKVELAAEKDHAQRHAELLSAIVESMADGLAVIDADGSVLLRNAAAHRIFGGRVSTDGHVASSAHYGLFHSTAPRSPTATPSSPSPAPGETSPTSQAGS
jgi:PAS domain-containing protein